VLFRSPCIGGLRLCTWDHARGEDAWAKVNLKEYSLNSENQKPKAEIHLDLIFIFLS
jgi:hypothetical protein